LNTRPPQSPLSRVPGAWSLVKRSGCAAVPGPLIADPRRKTSTDGVVLKEGFLPLTRASGWTVTTTFGCTKTGPSTNVSQPPGMVMLFGMLVLRFWLHAIGAGAPAHWNSTGFPAMTFSSVTRSPELTDPSAFSSRHCSGPLPPHRAAVWAGESTPPRSWSRRMPSPGSFETSALPLASPHAAVACTRDALPPTRHSAPSPTSSPFQVAILISYLLMIVALIMRWLSSEDRHRAGHAVHRDRLTGLELDG